VTLQHHHVALVGDSIFDNAVYVPGGPDVAEQLRHLLGDSWKVTLLAVDGDVVADVRIQLESMPTDATHIVVSVGGNDALQHLPLLQQPADSVADALTGLASAREAFRTNYRAMLDFVADMKRPFSVCTIYDSVPGLQPEANTALAIFNEVILREAISNGVPIIDLRVICTDAADYSALSPIEPSVEGGAKIVAAISAMLHKEPTVHGVVSVIHGDGARQPE
jgi:hypothetical protein